MVNQILSKANYVTAAPLHAEAASVEQVVLEAVAVSAKSAQLPPPAAPQPLVNKKDLAQAIDTLNKHVQLSQRGIVFAEDKDTGIDVIKVIDSKTKKVLLQFPSEDLIEVAKRLDDMRGVFFQKSA